MMPERERQAMPSYVLSPHVFLCRRGNLVILLDLRNDKYLAFDAPRALGLGDRIRGWPDHAQAITAAATPLNEGVAHDHSTRIVQQLLDRGLLMERNAAASDVETMIIEPPVAELFMEGLTGRPRVRAQHLVRFSISVFFTSVRLRTWSIEKLVGAVRRRSQRNIDAALDIEKARDLVAIYFALRPFLFTSANACLFDALALLEFLSRYRIYPRWVFGVRTAPFAAHCWVQAQGLIFNDGAEHARRYTPIMVV